MKGGEEIIAVSKIIIFREIDKLVEEIEANPAETERYKIECGKRLKDYTSSRVKGAIMSLFVRLYDGQIRLLKRDFAKCILQGGRDAEPSERTALLQCLFGTLRLLFGDDYSCLTNLLENELQRRIIFAEGIEDPEEEELLEKKELEMRVIYGDMEDSEEDELL